MATPEVQLSIRERATHLIASASALVDKSPEAQTRRATDEINAKVTQAKERARLFPIRIDPQILELVSHSMVIVAAERMEAKRKHAGARFDLMRDDAGKARAAFIAECFTDENLRQAMLDQNHDRQMAEQLIQWFYKGNPKVDIFGNMPMGFLDSRKALEQLFRTGQAPIPPQR